MLADDAARILSLLDDADAGGLRRALHLAVVGLVGVADADDPTACAAEVVLGLSNALTPATNAVPVSAGDRAA